MYVLGSMRWFRFAIVLCISLLTVGLQAAPGPYVLCVSKCEDGETGEMVQMLCWSGPSESGCRIVKADASIRGGCCAAEEVDLAELGCCAPDADEIAELGCCVADVSCPPFESCKQFPSDSDGNCPMGAAECFYCLPGRVLADRASEGEQYYGDGGRYLATLATDHLTLAHFARQNSHTHSPPGHIVAESGSIICIENCLFLI